MEREAPTSLDLSTLNEADVREEIISPLLNKLGYSSGTPNNIMRELTLSYPKRQLGRQKKSDVRLSGRADYICETANHIRWVVEAKPPQAKLDSADQAQAHSYAVHPEVRAKYFCLCNGYRFVIYEADRGPTALAIAEFSQQELESNFDAIAGLLKPESIITRFPDYKSDEGMPLGVGLRSIARVSHGFVEFDSGTPDVPSLIGVTHTVSGGVLQRNEDGSLTAQLVTRVPQNNVHALNRKLGLDQMSITTPDTVLSTNENAPTVFAESTLRTLPKGEKIPAMEGNQEIQFPMDVNVNTLISASGHLESKRFHGAYSASLELVEFQTTVHLEGRFEIFFV